MLLRYRTFSGKRALDCLFQELVADKHTQVAWQRLGLVVKRLHSVSGENVQTSNPQPGDTTGNGCVELTTPLTLPNFMAQLVVERHWA